MKINLRKASAIIQVLGAEISNAKTEMLSYTNKHFSVYADDDEALKNYQSEFAKAKKTFETSLNTLYKIRRDIAKVNEVAGIDQILNDIAYYTAMISVYEHIAKAPALDKIVLNSKLKQALKYLDNENSYMPSDNVTSSVITEDMKISIHSDLLSMKRKKRSLQDELLEKNITSHIHLDDTDVKVLKELGIV